MVDEIKQKIWSQSSLEHTETSSEVESVSEETTDRSDPTDPKRINALENKIKELEKKSEKIYSRQTTLKRIQDKEYSIVTTVALVVSFFTAVAFCTLAVEYLQGNTDRYNQFVIDINFLKARVDVLENKIK